MRRVAFVCLTTFLLAVAGVWIYALAPALPNAQFELDGNIVVNSAPSDDWANTVPPPKGASSEAVASTFVHDGGGNAETIFFQGGSKDTLDVDNWRYTNGSVPDKDDISDAFAAAYVNGSDLTLYFGLDRSAQNGSMTAGFWFFKNQVLLGPAGRFVGADGQPAHHSDGDVFIIADMSNGGQVFKAAAFRWIGGSLIPFATEADNAHCGTNTDPDLCFTTNTGTLPAPWPYTPKSGSPGVIPVFGFFEGGVNVQILGGGGLGGCFSSFIAETRSSNADGSSLQDFALGEFNTCDIDIVKSCPAAPTFAGGVLTYTSVITVTNSGFGTVFDVTVTDTPSAPAAPVTQVVAATLAAGASVTFNHSFSYTAGPSSPNPPSNTASVTAATAAGGAQVINGGNASATCQSVSFDSALSITKNAVCQLAVVDGKVVVKVIVSGTVSNTAPAAPAIPETITGVVVTDVPTIDGQPLAIGDLAPNQVKPWGPSFYYPSALTGGNPSPPAQLFEDTALAQGTGQVTGVTRQNTITASCRLCPPGEPTAEHAMTPDATPIRDLMRTLLRQPIDKR